MDARRDDITGEQRMQIVVEVLASQRPYGTVSQLAQRYAVSRQTVYQMAAKGQQVLSQGLEPGRHGPDVGGPDIVVDRNRLVRGSVRLSAVGVSQRDIEMCLEELLDSSLSTSWVNAVLAEVEAAAVHVNESWQPQLEETLAGDEIYANGQPNLLVVGNASLYIYALSRRADCDGDTWGCTLLAGPVCQQFAATRGKVWRLGLKRLRSKFINWIGIICCGRCGAKRRPGTASLRCLGAGRAASDPI